MKAQLPFDRRLGIQRFLQGADCKVAGDVAVCDAGNNTLVMQAYDGAVVPHFVVRKEQIGKAGAPFLIHFIRSEVLLQLVFKYFVRFPVFMARFYRADDGTQTELGIHIFVYSCGTVIISPACQADRHAPVAGNPIMAVADVPELCHDSGFSSMVIRLLVFSVVVIGIWAYGKPAERPADAKFLMVLVYESVSL